MLFRSIGLAATLLARRARRQDPVEARWRRIVRRLRRRGIVRSEQESDAAFARRAVEVLATGNAAPFVAGAAPTAGMNDFSRDLPELADRVEAHRYGPPEEWSADDTAAFIALADRLTLDGRARRARSAQR